MTRKSRRGDCGRKRTGAGPIHGVNLVHDQGGAGRIITLTGEGVDAALREALVDWLKRRR